MPVNMRLQPMMHSASGCDWSALPAACGAGQPALHQQDNTLASSMQQQCSTVPRPAHHHAAATPSLPRRSNRNLHVQIPHAFTDDSASDSSLRPSALLPTMGIFEVQRRMGLQRCPSGQGSGSQRPAAACNHYHHTAAVAATLPCSTSAATVAMLIATGLPSDCCPQTTNWSDVQADQWAAMVET